jgi:hypothetical protein
MVSRARLSQAFLVFFIVVVCLAYVIGSSSVAGPIGIIIVTTSILILLHLWWENPAQPL